MQLQDILYAQGFGTRRICAGLIQQGHVLVWSAEEGACVPCTDVGAVFEPEGLPKTALGKVQKAQLSG